MTKSSAADRYAARQTEEIKVSVNEDEPDDLEVIEEPAEEHEPVVIETPDEEPELEDEDEPDALAALQTQLESMQGKLDERERRDEEAAVHAADAELVSQHNLLVDAANAAKVALDKAEADYAKHAEAGEWTKAARAQRTMAEASADMREYADGARELKRTIETQRKQPRQPATAPAGEDRFEASIKDMSEPTKQWVRKNKEDITKPGRFQRAYGAHLMAITDGIKPDTPEYFAFVNKHMGYEDEPTMKTPQKRAAAPVGRPRAAAPAGGRVPTRNSVDEVRLTRQQIETAKMLGMTNKAYAKQVREIQLNGQDSTRGGPRFTSQTEAGRR